MGSPEPGTAPRLRAGTRAGASMISSILLAAGMSTRMGEPKALLDWGGEPLIRYQIRQIQEAGVDEVALVLGPPGGAGAGAPRPPPPTSWTFPATSAACST